MENQSLNYFLLKNVNLNLFLSKNTPEQEEKKKKKHFRNLYTSIRV